MSQDPSHIDDIFNDEIIPKDILEKYLSGELSAEEKHKIERSMVEHDLYHEGIEGINNSDIEGAVFDIDNFIDELTAEKKKRRFLIPIFSGVAASAVLLIMVLAYNFNEDTDTQVAYKAEHKESMTERNSDAKATSKTEEFTLSDDIAVTEEPSVTATNEQKKAFLAKREAEKSKSLVQKRSEVVENEVVKKGYVDSLVFDKKLWEKRDFVNPEEEMDNGDVGEIEEDDLEIVILKDEMIAESDPSISIEKTKGVGKSSVMTIADDMWAYIEKHEKNSYANGGFYKNISKKNKAKSTVRTDSYQKVAEDISEHKDKKIVHDTIAERETNSFDQEAFAHLKKGEYNQAAKKYELVLLQSPDEPIHNYYAGISQYKTGHFEKANQYFSKALNKKSLQENTYWYMAMSYLKRDKKSLAKKYLTKVVKNKSTHQAEAKKILEKLK